MKQLKIITMVIIFVATGVLVSSCKDAKNERFDIEKSELTIKINNALKIIDSKISDLENQLGKAREETAESIKNNIDKLKERRAELSEDLKDLNDEMDENWETFKTNINKAIEDTEEWINNIEIDLDNDSSTVDKK